MFLGIVPKALPWAISFRPVGSADAATRQDGWPKDMRGKGVHDIRDAATRQDAKAQGNALGMQPRHSQALKGRNPTPQSQP